MNTRVEKALNDQIRKEASSSQYYLAMASWSENHGLNGTAKFLYAQSDEERFHMLKLVKFVNERGGKAIIPSMKGFEFVAFAGELEGLKRKDALRRSHEILDCLSMGEARFRKLGEYSTGMIQKVKLAQALVHDPDLLILDEPTAGLDPPARNQMLDYLSYFARQQGKSIVLSTHLLGDVHAVCYQFVFLLCF
jgi:ABC-2 type transport system ATP-binding protein